MSGGGTGPGGPDGCGRGSRLPLAVSRPRRQGAACWGGFAGAGVASPVALVTLSGQTIPAINQTRRAEQLAALSRHRLARLYLAEGDRLLAPGDATAALLWFAEALRTDEGDP